MVRTGYSLQLPNNMICVTRLNGKKFYVNADLIQTVEATPDTVITLTNNIRYIVRDPIEEIIERITLYYQRVYTAQIVSSQDDLLQQEHE